MAIETPKFAVPVDFTGITPWDPTKGGMNDPDPGAYPGRTVAAVHYEKDDGKKSIKVTVNLEGQGETDLYVPLDFSKPTNLQKAAAALTSVGIPLAKLGLVKTLTPEHFMGTDGKGRPCHVLVKLVDGTDGQGRKKLNDKEWMSKEQFEAYKSAPAASRPTATPTTTPAPLPPPGGSLENLFG